MGTAEPMAIDSRVEKPILEVTELCAAYGRVQVLEQVSFYVDEGTAIAIIGPNGAGKSTTLGALAGTVKQSAGRVTFDGDSVLGLTPDAIARKGMLLVPEGRHVFEGLTVRENLELGLTLVKDRPTRAERLRTVYEYFPVLHDRTALRAGMLSGGEQQQLALARALARGPRVLLLDEPSLGLAPKTCGIVFETLQRMQQEQRLTLVLVEQNAGWALEITDRCYIMRSGRIVTEGSSEQMAAEEDFASHYLN